MKPPILLPRDMDDLLEQRFVAERIYFRAWAHECSSLVVARQRRFVKRLNKLIARRAA